MEKWADVWKGELIMEADRVEEKATEQAKKRSNLIDSVAEVAEIAAECGEEKMAVNLLLVAVFAECDLDGTVSKALEPAFRALIAMKNLGILEPKTTPERTERCEALVEKLLIEATKEAK